jgi:hypothetical protein
MLLLHALLLLSRTCCRTCQLTNQVKHVMSRADNLPDFYAIPATCPVSFLQWERNAAALQDQVEAVQHSKAMLQQQLQIAESQLSQLQANALLDKLVETKLQLAQADLQVSTLQGELKNERQRYSKLTTQLVTLQLQHDGLQEQHKELQDVAKQQQRQLQAAGLGSSCGPLPGVLSSSLDSVDLDQGEGLTLQYSAPASYATQQLSAARPDAPLVKRIMSSPAGTSVAGKDSSGGSGSWNWGSWIRPVNSLIRFDSSASSSSATNGLSGPGSARSTESTGRQMPPQQQAVRSAVTPALSSRAGSSMSSQDMQPRQQLGARLQQDRRDVSTLLAEEGRRRAGSYGASDEPGRSSGSSDQDRYSSAGQRKHQPALARQSWGGQDSRIGV